MVTKMLSESTASRQWTTPFGEWIAAPDGNNCQTLNEAAAMLLSPAPGGKAGLEAVASPFPGGSQPLHRALSLPPATPKQYNSSQANLPLLTPSETVAGLLPTAASVPTHSMVLSPSPMHPQFSTPSGFTPASPAPRPGMLSIPASPMMVTSSAMRRQASLTPAACLTPQAIPAGMMELNRATSMPGLKSSQTPALALGGTAVSAVDAALLHELLLADPSLASSGGLASGQLLDPNLMLAAAGYAPMPGGSPTQDLVYDAQTGHLLGAIQSSPALHGVIDYSLISPGLQQLTSPAAAAGAKQQNGLYKVSRAAWLCKELCIMLNS